MTWPDSRFRPLSPRPPRAQKASARSAPAQAATRRLRWLSLHARVARPHPSPPSAFPSSPSANRYTLLRRETDRHATAFRVYSGYLPGGGSSIKTSRTGRRGVAGTGRPYPSRRISCGQPVPAQIYIASKVEKGLRPSGPYLQAMLDGAGEHNLPASYIGEIKSAAGAA